MTDKLLLTPQEAARIAGVGRDRAYSLIDSGEWPSVLIGKRRKVPASFLYKRYGGDSVLVDASTTHRYVSTESVITIRPCPSHLQSKPAAYRQVREYAETMQLVPVVDAKDRVVGFLEPKQIPTYRERLTLLSYDGGMLAEAEGEGFYAVRIIEDDPTDAQPSPGMDAYQRDVKKRVARSAAGGA